MAKAFRGKHLASFLLAGTHRRQGTSARPHSGAKLRAAPAQTSSSLMWLATTPATPRNTRCRRDLAHHMMRAVHCTRGDLHPAPTAGRRRWPPAPPGWLASCAAWPLNTATARAPGQALQGLATPPQLESYDRPIDDWKAELFHDGTLPSPPRALALPKWHADCSGQTPTSCAP